LLRKATSCFGCSRNVNVSFVVTSAAALNEDLRLEVAAACAFDIVAYMVAVFFGGEPRDREFAAVDAQPRNVHGFRRCGICDLNDLLKVFVGLRLARARVLVAKVTMKSYSSTASARYRGRSASRGAKWTNISLGPCMRPLMR
jgi:hypothetical protein